MPDDDQLDPDDLAALDAVLEASEADVAAGRLLPAEEVLAEVRRILRSPPRS